MKKFSDLGITPSFKGMEGTKISIDEILNREIIVHRYSINDSKFHKENNDKCLSIQISLDETKHVVFTGSQVLMEDLQKIPVNEFPFIATIIKKNKWYQFT